MSAAPLDPRKAHGKAPKRDEKARRLLFEHLEEIVGYPLSEGLVSLHRPGAGLIHHSDGGVQYASGEYIGRLKEVGAQISMATLKRSAM
jgi:transposase InsO family protein